MCAHLQRLHRSKAHRPASLGYAEQWENRNQLPEDVLCLLVHTRHFKSQKIQVLKRMPCLQGTPAVGVAYLCCFVIEGYGEVWRAPTCFRSPVQKHPGFMLVFRAAGFCLSPYEVSLSPGLGCSREHHSWNCSGTVSTRPLGGAVAFSLLLGKPLTLPQPYPSLSASGLCIMLLSLCWVRAL